MSNKKKSAQGRSLPVDGSPISAYPVGCCVLAPMVAGAPADWLLIAFRVGLDGLPNVRRMTSDPHVAGWELSPSSTSEVDRAVVVSSSCWPHRFTDGQSMGSENDPLLANIQASR